MRIANIQNSVSNQYALNSKKKAVNFTATPEQIIFAVQDNAMCHSKAGFLKSIAMAFRDIQKGLIKTDIDHIDYKLGQVNEFPEALANKKEGDWWKGADKILNEDAFSCSSGSNCNCGKGETKGEFFKELLEKLHVENPSVITLTRPEKKKFLFFGYYV